MIELAQVGDGRECCGERYLLVEQQRGTQSGLRIEEACELTTLDIVKRRHGDGRSYYRCTSSRPSSTARG